MDDTAKRNSALEILHAAALVGSGIGIMITGRDLLVGPFPTHGGLYLTYLLFSSLLLAFSHLAFFFWDACAIQKSLPPWPRNFPRYLEYVYAAVISTSLFQVFFMAPNFADYITMQRGDGSSLAAQMVNQAVSHLENDCGGDDEFFTPAYCERLRKLVEAPIPATYVEEIVLKDLEFLNHAIKVETVCGKGGCSDVPRLSPIARHANALAAILEYKTGKPEPAERAYGWIGLLLLPVGISIRVLKTSVELFGRAHRLSDTPSGPSSLSRKHANGGS